MAQYRYLNLCFFLSGTFCLRVICICIQPIWTDRSHAQIEPDSYWCEQAFRSHGHLCFIMWFLSTETGMLHKPVLNVPARWQQMWECRCRQLWWEIKINMLKRDAIKDHSVSVNFLLCVLNSKLHSAKWWSHKQLFSIRISISMIS